MTPEQWISMYTITLAILGPVTGATLYGLEREKTRKEIAKERSVGAQAVFGLMEQLTKIRQDIDRLQGSDKAQADEIHVLEEDYKKLTRMIIELLKLK